MQRHGGIFVPEFIDVGAKDGSSKLVPFGRNIDRAVEMMSRSRYPFLIAKRHEPVDVSYNFEPHDFVMFDWMSIAVEVDWFREKGNTDKMMAFASDLYGSMEAASGRVRHEKHEQRMNRVEGYVGETFVSSPVEMGPKRHLPGLYWANILGPEYVDMWGRRLLLKAPCHRVDELSDGGMILYLSESPLDAGTAQYRQAKARLLRYLGPEAFDGRREPKFRTKGRWRKKRDARPLVETGGVREDVFADEPPLDTR